MAKVASGETLAKLRFYLTSTDVSGVETPVDLTGCTLQAKYAINGGTTKTMNLSIVGLPTAGIAEGQSVTASWDTAGVAIGRVFITSGANVGKSWKWTLEIEPE